MSTVPVTKVESARLGTVLSVIRRGKFLLEGDEVLAFAQAYSWLIEFKTAVDKALAAAPEPPKEGP